MEQEDLRGMRDVIYNTKFKGIFVVWLNNCSGFCCLCRLFGMVGLTYFLTAKQKNNCDEFSFD